MSDAFLHFKKQKDRGNARSILCSSPYSDLPDGDRTPQRITDAVAGPALGRMLGQYLGPAMSTDLPVHKPADAFGPLEDQVARAVTIRNTSD